MFGQCMEHAPYDGADLLVGHRFGIGQLHTVGRELCKVGDGRRGLKGDHPLQKLLCDVRWQIIDAKRVPVAAGQTACFRFEPLETLVLIHVLLLMDGDQEQQSGRRVFRGNPAKGDDGYADLALDIAKRQGKNCDQSGARAMVKALIARQRKSKS